jgi:hypothetical protein
MSRRGHSILSAFHPNGISQLFDQFGIDRECRKHPQGTLLVNIGKAVEDRLQEDIPDGITLSECDFGLA